MHATQIQTAEYEQKVEQQSQMLEQEFLKLSECVGFNVPLDTQSVILEMSLSRQLIEDSFNELITIRLDMRLDHLVSKFSQ